MSYSPTTPDPPADSPLASVDEAPICPGCGLVSHLTHGNICHRCFYRREQWAGDGPTRVFAPGEDIHATPLCSEFDADRWRHCPDEDALYRTLNATTDASYCSECLPSH